LSFAVNTYIDRVVLRLLSRGLAMHTPGVTQLRASGATFQGMVRKRSVEDYGLAFLMAPYLEVVGSAGFPPTLPHCIFLGAGGPPAGVTSAGAEGWAAAGSPGVTRTGAPGVLGTGCGL